MKSGMIKKVALFATLLFTMASAQAAKDFAEAKVVLQISDDDPAKQALVLNVASNLKQLYGQDQVEVEIVGFGPGLKLLLANSQEKDRVISLAGSGVKFSACGNTMKKMAKKTGKDPVLNKNVAVVDAGVKRILDLTKDGYQLVRP